MSGGAGEALLSQIGRFLFVWTQLECVFFEYRKLPYIATNCADPLA